MSLSCFIRRLNPETPIALTKKATVEWHVLRYSALFPEIVYARSKKLSNTVALCKGGAPFHLLMPSGYS
jgi:hypothetical protein